MAPQILGRELLDAIGAFFFSLSLLDDCSLLMKFNICALFQM